MSISTQLVKKLVQIPIFGGLTVGEAAEFFEVAQESTIAPGSTLFGEGDEGSSLMVVLEGEGLANDATALILYRFAVAAAQVLPLLVETYTVSPAARLALTGKPSSASFSAGATTLGHFIVPYFSSAHPSPATEPGTPTAR